MFNFRIKNKRKTLVILIAIMFTFSSQIYGFDLLSRIQDNFQKVYDKGTSSEYLNMPYSSVYSKDPYGDELKNTENMKTQLQLAGVDAVEQALAEKYCSMSKKEIRGILYYYVPEFREDIARTLKLENGDTDSNKFILEKEEVVELCTEYFQCELRNYWVYREGNNIPASGYIDAYTAKDLETNCKNFFEKNYKKGQEKESRNQSVEESQLGNDKYRNATLEDSPYDIMSDLGVVAKLLFEESQDPIQPVFYHLPMFRNAEKAAEDYKNQTENGNISDNGNQGGGGGGGGGEGGGGGGGGEGGEGGGGGGGGEGGGGGNAPTPGPKSPSVLDEYDDLIEGLGASSLNFYNGIEGKICADEDLEPEINGEKTFYKDPGNVGGNDETQGGSEGNTTQDDSGVSEDDFNDYMNNIINKVDDYMDDEVEKTQRDKTKEEIENCLEGCKGEGLRADQKLSCKMMCVCGEVDSPIFDSKKTEGLGPLFKIRFCTVPAQDMKFSVGGKRIVSVEEGINEIYGVVDKLSREGKLGMWTQQRNFLDSTTKKMNMANTFAFSIDVERVDLANKLPNYSKQYREYIARKNNEKWQKLYGIQNSIDDPVGKNKYGALASHYYNVTDFSSILNSEISRNEKADLLSETQTIVNENEDANANRYTSLSSSLDILIRQQANFWINASLYIKNFHDYAVHLYSKKEKK